MVIGISTLLFILFVFFEAWREAIYWHVKGGGVYDTWKSKPEEHTLFTIQRGIFFLSLILGMIFTTHWIGILTSTIGFALIFSFIHNGFYYMFRNRLNPEVYKEGFWSQSTTSVAKLTKFMTPISRTIQFGIGISILIFGIILDLLK